MADRPAYAPVFESVYRIALEMPPEDQSRLLMACCAYAFDGEEPELDGMLGAIFEQVAKPSIDRSVERMRRNQRIAESRRSGAVDRPECDQTDTTLAPDDTTPVPEPHQTDTRPVPDEHQSAPEADKTKDQGPRTNPSPKEGEGGSKGGAAPRAPADARRFTPPTLDEVAEFGDAFCRERGIPPGSFDPEAFVDYWASVGWRRGRTPMRDWRATARNWIKHDNPEAKGGGGHDIFDAYA